ALVGAGTNGSSRARGSRPLTRTHSGRRSELPAPTRGEGTIICTASLLSQASATRTLRIDVPSPLGGEGSSAGRHELTGVRGAPPQAPPDPRVDKPIHNGSSSVPSRSRFGVAISPSSRSSS